MSYVYPDARDQRRIANSNSKTLLQNWVEEVRLICCDYLFFGNKNFNFEL